ncbi:hypothetical protein RJ639_022453 [Escallonia herrerae]|uniref:Crossover junction endonuclease MUS81 n=1 Tax=Escallonia herrerae TaxID=1293975 RepID=A0AA88V6P1_9ASTE|nr:hypothetical protein RJ639_022453 [Escallonia herrerae]
MERQRQVVCADNEELAAFMWNKRREMAEGPKGVSENIDLTLSKAYSNVCSSISHIKTMKDFSQIKGVGKWILRLMQSFFKTDSDALGSEELPTKRKKNKGTKHYMPQKNSVAYALLVALYRGTATGSDFMRKQELIDSAEASGLSRAPIMPEKGKGKPGQFGSSPRDWYSGWSCMKTLITKGLVVKSSCPAKYMLTEQGKEAARDCLLRSGLGDNTDALGTGDRSPEISLPYLEGARAGSLKEVGLPYAASSRQKESFNVPPKSLDRFVRMGYSKEQILCAFAEVSETSGNKEMSSLWPAVMCRLREEQVYGLPLESPNIIREDHLASSTSYLPTSYLSRDDHVDLTCENRSANSDYDAASYIPKSLCPVSSPQGLSILRACSSTGDGVTHVRGGLGIKSNALRLPPLTFGERFGDLYQVVLILDDREKFTTQGSKSRKIIDHICGQFKIKIEVRRLPVGDGIWIARHKHLASEYVLDFIVERKKVDDLRCSIRDNRYRDQKVRLLSWVNVIALAGLLHSSCILLGLPFGAELQVQGSLGFDCTGFQKLIGWMQVTAPASGVLKVGVDVPESTLEDSGGWERCGLKKIIYLVEGDANASEAAESIKTACFTTEILEGFDVQRTSGLADTLRKYGYLTQSIVQYYTSLEPEDEVRSPKVCPPFTDFMKRCQDSDKMTVSDVFATQLMQVPQVTEDVAIAVLDLYPTLLSLARAYILLDGDIGAQEEMLKKQSNNVVSGAASRNIFQLVWGS